MNIKIELLKYYPSAIPCLANICFRMLGKWSPGISLEEMEDWCYEWLNTNLPLAYIALDHNIPMGLCSLQLNDGISSDLMPWLGDLCVDTPYQSKGVGKLLINATRLCEQNLKL